MPLIDAHVHLVDPARPGADKSPEILSKGRLAIVEAVRENHRIGNILVAMGSLATKDFDPLGIGSTVVVGKELAKHQIDVRIVGIMDPSKGLDEAHLEKVKEELKNKKVIALKGYLGYLHFKPSDKEYEGYIKLAGEFGLPVIFHTGGMRSREGLLKYARPLLIDEVAVKYPEVQFVMAHFGNPWMMDAAGVMVKNENVWADLSGIVCPDTPKDSNKTASHFKALQSAAERLNEAVLHTEAPERIIYGSDWPMMGSSNYADWVVGALTSIRPDFDENARRLFKIE